MGMRWRGAEEHNGDHLASSAPCSENSKSSSKGGGGHVSSPRNAGSSGVPSCQHQSGQRPPCSPGATRRTMADFAQILFRDSSNVSPATARAGQLPPTASRAAKNTASGIADHDGFIDVEVQDESSSPRVHAFGFVRGRQEVPLFKSDRRAD